MDWKIISKRINNKKFNEKGNLALLKHIDGNFDIPIVKENKFIENYNKNNTYKMGISFNHLNGDIITSINDEFIYSTNDKTLKGNLVGFISLGKNTVFKQILTEEFGPKIAQGAEAKVYYKEGNTSVVKERTSIYST